MAVRPHQWHNQYLHPANSLHREEVRGDWSGLTNARLDLRRLLFVSGVKLKVDSELFGNVTCMKWRKLPTKHKYDCKWSYTLLQPEPQCFPKLDQVPCPSPWLTHCVTEWKKKENKKIQLTLCQLIIHFQKFSRFVSEPRNSQLAVCWKQSHFFALLWLADS